MDNNQVSIGSLSAAAGMINVPSYKVGETFKIQIHPYGGINLYTDGNPIAPHDKVIEVEIKAVKKLKVEFEDIA